MTWLCLVQLTLLEKLLGSPVDCPSFNLLWASHGESVPLWLKTSGGDIHVLACANSAPRSSGGGITCAAFHKGDARRGLGRDALNLPLKKRAPTFPLFAPGLCLVFGWSGAGRVDGEGLWALGPARPAAL